MAGCARVVEGAPSWVELPLGLVALFWLRQYMPLLKAGLPLVGGGAGVEEVYAGVRVRVRVQRQRLRFDLGVGDWGA